MIEDCVVILGSGESINCISDEERRILDSCPVKISINKFAAFCNLANIYPTHIFFTDDYYESARLFFRFMTKRLKLFGLENLTFIVSKRMSEYLLIPKNGNFIAVYITKLTRNLVFNIESKGFAWGEKYPIVEKIFSKLFGLPKEHFHQFVILPKNSQLHTVTIISHLEREAPWAKSLDEPLYHYKGSFSSVLNYISIFFPDRRIILVGVDFNTPDYFFENELSKIKFDTKDWTYELRQKEKKHYSIIETDGKKIDDDLPYMIEQLRKTGNVMYSINQKSYLVEKEFVQHINFSEL